jgi:hypothetical protein
VCFLLVTDRPLPSTYKRHSTVNSRDDANKPWAGGGVRSLLDRTLGLHQTTHSTLIGASSLHDSALLDLFPHPYRPGEGESWSKFRRVDPSTSFVTRQDSHTLFHGDDIDDLEAVEATVRPHGPALVALYFRIVHPSYPILHKGVFLEKYGRSYREFSPPLLAAVYALAMDWWDYDRELSSKSPPDGARLIKVATKTLTSVIHRPKISTVQAGLLLLQRSGGDSWPLTAQIVAVAQELGLHRDCASWNIPDWEKGLRRRLTWAIYMQDKWGSLVYGRPSHITPSGWHASPLQLADFPESAADEDEKEGSTEVEKGRLLFIHLARLTEILAEALAQLYTPDQARNAQLLAARGLPGLLDLVKPTAVALKDWAASMPAGLRMEDVKTRKLCSNGYLHLSYFAAEIAVHRYLVRALAADTPAHLRALCRDAARSRLEHAMAFVESLRPEHLQGFWWFASSKCLALIGVYGALLWATSGAEDEGEAYRAKLEDFRWSLKVRAKGSSFLTAAIRELDDCLEGIDFKQVQAATPASATVSHATMSHADVSQDVDDVGQHGFGGEFGDMGAMSTANGFEAMGFDPTMPHSIFSDLGDIGMGFPGLGSG